MLSLGNWGGGLKVNHVHVRVRVHVMLHVHVPLKSPLIPPIFLTMAEKLAYCFRSSFTSRILVPVHTMYMRYMYMYTYTDLVAWYMYMYIHGKYVYSTLA